MNDVTGFRRLTVQERRLVRAAEQDTVADLRAYENGQRPVIHARLLRELCTGHRSWHVKDRIRMIGGRVEGRLDPSGAHLAHPLEFSDCVFEEIDLRKAHAEKSLAWVGGKDVRINAMIADEFGSEDDLTISGVTVTGVISLNRANVRGDLRLTNSRLLPRGGQAFAGRDLRVGGTLFLDGPDFYAGGEVCLRSAHVKGDLNCRHARFDNPSGRSIDGGHLLADGEVLLEGNHEDTLAPSHHGTQEGFRSDGEVNLQWAQVRRLRATGGKFANPSGFALHADAMRSKDGVYLDRGFEATAEVRLVGAQITGELCCTKGTFSNPIGMALNAERVRTDDVYLDRGFAATGQVRFTDAQVSRQFNAIGGSFCNERAGAYSLDADGLLCGGDVFLNEGFRAIGTVSLAGAEIRSELNCAAGSFRSPNGYALFADGLTTPGMVHLDNGFLAIGEVRLARATVGRQLKCTDGTFDNQHGIAFDLTGLVCLGDVLLNSTGNPDRALRATGEIRLKGAQITRDLDFTHARLYGPEGLDARGINVGNRLIWMLELPAEGPVNLSSAQVGQLVDNPQSWGSTNTMKSSYTDPYAVTGMIFELPTETMPKEQRAQWLRGATEYPGDAVWEQVARSFRRIRNEADARWIEIAGQRDNRDRGGLPPGKKFWDWLMDVSVGYGRCLYRPFFLLLALVLIGSVIYYLGERDGLIHATQGNHVAAPACPAGYSCFNPLIYSAEIMIPVVDFRLVDNWTPEGNAHPWGLLLLIYTWLVMAIGWVVGIVVIPGVKRFLETLPAKVPFRRN